MQPGNRGDCFYLRVCIHRLELKLGDGLPHALPYPQAQVPYNRERVVHRAYGDVESPGHLNGRKCRWDTRPLHPPKQKVGALSALFLGESRGE